MKQVAKMKKLFIEFMNTKSFVDLDVWESLALLLIAGSIFLISNASAVTINQNQLDSINAQTYDLQCQRELIRGQTYSIENGAFIIAFSCLEIERLTDTTYNVFRSTFNPRFTIADYRECKRLNTQLVCVNRFIDFLQSQINLYKRSFRNKIELFQTPDSNEISTNFGGVDFDE